MLWWALMFFVVALVAAVFGFTSIAIGLATLAQVIFFIFVVLSVVSLIFGVVRRSRA